MTSYSDGLVAIDTDCDTNHVCRRLRIGRAEGAAVFLGGLRKACRGGMKMPKRVEGSGMFVAKHIKLSDLMHILLRVASTSSARRTLMSIGSTISMSRTRRLCPHLAAGRVRWTRPSKCSRGNGCSVEWTSGQCGGHIHATRCGNHTHGRTSSPGERKSGPGEGGRQQSGMTLRVWNPLHRQRQMHASWK